MSTQRRHAGNSSAVGRTGRGRGVSGRALSDDQELLAQHTKKRRSLVAHWGAYAGIVGILGFFNVMVGLLFGALPLVLLLAVPWGLWLCIHGLSYQGWVREYSSLLRAARYSTGVAASKQP